MNEGSSLHVPREVYRTQGDFMKPEKRLFLTLPATPAMKRNG